MCMMHTLVPSQVSGVGGWPTKKKSANPASAGMASRISKYKVLIKLCLFGLLNLFVISSGCSQCLSHQRKLSNFFKEQLKCRHTGVLDQLVVTCSGRTHGGFLQARLLPPPVLFFGTVTARMTESYSETSFVMWDTLPDISTFGPQCLHKVYMVPIITTDYLSEHYPVFQIGYPSNHLYL